MQALFMSAMLVCVLACSATVSLAADSASKKLSGYWTPKNDKEPYGQVLLDRLPKGTHILIDTQMVPELPVGDYGGLKVTKRALDEVRKFDAAKQRGRSEACVRPSMTYVLQAPFPMEIYAYPDVVIFRQEYFDITRIIFLDGRKHPTGDFPHTKEGHSIGHWEGEELVVDTTHIASATMLNNGFNHSDDIHVIERFRLSPDGNTLWATQLYEDSAVFEQRAARYVAFRRGPAEGFVFPYDCDPGYASE